MDEKTPKLSDAVKDFIVRLNEIDDNELGALITFLSGTFEARKQEQKGTH
jgi:hypothetical protein